MPTDDHRGAAVLEASGRVSSLCMNECMYACMYVVCMHVLFSVVLSAWFIYVYTYNARAESHPNLNPSRRRGKRSGSTRCSMRRRDGYGPTRRAARPKFWADGPSPECAARVAELKRNLIILFSVKRHTPHQTNALGDTAAESECAARG